jgi:hypothetical protein
MSAAMQVEVRVAENWTAALEVNGERITDANIGLTRLDRRNKVATYTFVGLNLRPGQNRVRAFAVSPEGKAGRAAELNVMGRGPARRLEITADREELPTGGRDAALLRIRAFDQWNHPAADAQIAVSTSNGHLRRSAGDAAALETKSNGSSREDKLQMTTSGIGAEETNANLNQLVLALRGGEASVQLVSDSAAGVAEIKASTGNIAAEKRLRFTA